jgi:hypothetical protein
MDAVRVGEFLGGMIAFLVLFWLVSYVRRQVLVKRTPPDAEKSGTVPEGWRGRRFVRVAGLIVLSAFLTRAYLSGGRFRFEAERVVWNRVTMPDGRSAMTMPIGPVVSHSPLEIDGASIETTVLQWVSDDESTLFTCVQIPDKRTPSRSFDPGSFRGLIQQMASRKGWTIIADQPISLRSKWKGHEFRLETRGGSFAAFRYYYVHDRLYNLQAIVPAARRHSHVIEQFLDSFEIRDEPALGAPGAPGPF